MKIFIATMPEEQYIGKMIKYVITNYNEYIAGVAIIDGSPLGKGKFSKKLRYGIIFSLILGPLGLLRRLIFLGQFYLKKLFYFFNLVDSYSIATHALKFKLPLIKLDDLNSKESISVLKKLDIDIIINQTQTILKKDILECPNIGIINRHGALLPKYRGLMSPFWALKNNEKLSGVSIHFVDEKIDNGPIIVQKEIPIKKFDTFAILINRIFNITPFVMGEALDILINNKNFNDKLKDNNFNQSSYFSRPEFKDIIPYYISNFRRVFL